MNLAFPAFIAGFLMFLAPCTLPLVPGYLGFISGVSLEHLDVKKARHKIFINGLLYVFGFSAVFISLGTVFAASGALFGGYRIWLARVGGKFIVFFGLYTLGFSHLRAFQFLARERTLPVIKYFSPGNPVSSLVFGMTFALGWTPCVGPILGSILTLAATAGSIKGGAVLLALFSLGLAIPFLLIALFIGSAMRFVARYSSYLAFVSLVGGVFLVFLGLLIFTDNLAVWTGIAYRLFQFINYDALINYL